MTKKQTIEEVLYSDMTELPEELRKKLNGICDRTDEPTEVTKLMEELEECAADAKEELNKTGEIVRRVSRLTRKPGSSQKLKLVLSTPPPPPDDLPPQRS